VKVRALATKKMLVLATYFFQYRMDFKETTCVRLCAVPLRIRKDRRKKRHYVHPVVSKGLLYRDFFNCMRI
jgi:hypothetical protein